MSHKIALVTGGASGIGKAIAERLTAEGASVAITDVQLALGQETAARCGFGFFEQDVTDELQWSQTICNVQERYGGLHVLVNNAGILGSRDGVSPEDTSLLEWRKVFSVNVESVFLGCRAVIAAIHASGGGSIINVSSVAGLIATPHAAAYGASKAAVRQLTKSVAQHCAERKLKIRCNSVHPGVVRTPLWDQQAQDAAHKSGVSLDDYLKQSRSSIPLGDFSLPQDIAAAVAFLAAEDSRFITGSQLIVDGGFFHCDTYRGG